MSDFIHVLSPTGVTRVTPTTTISVDELNASIAAKAEPTIPAELDRVEVTTNEHGISVTPFWKHVERSQGSGYSVRTKRDADRLKKAIEAGVVYTNAFVTRDAQGNTYVTSGRTVMGRHLNADLKRLGY